MKTILKYISFVVLISPVYSFAQDSTWIKGIRLGCDLSRFVLPLTQPDRKAAVEFSIDMEWKPSIFPTAELGFENVQIDNDNIDYKSNSIYGRIGYDRNILKNDNSRFRDMFFVGYRYGLAMVHQEIQSYTIADPYKTWGSVTSSYPAKTTFHHWVELVGGTRAALTNCIYLGLSARVRLKLYSQKDINDPFVIPGFGNGSKKIVLGFNYSLYFQIPVKKVKIIKTELEKK
jgi:hypothetical protein